MKNSISGETSCVNVKILLSNDHYNHPRILKPIRNNSNMHALKEIYLFRNYSTSGYWDSDLACKKWPSKAPPTLIHFNYPH